MNIWRDLNKGFEKIGEYCTIDPEDEDARKIKKGQFILIVWTFIVFQFGLLLGSS